MVRIDKLLSHLIVAGFFLLIALSDVGAHSLQLGTLDGEIQDARVRILVTLPEGRTLDDRELFESYANETLQLNGDGSACALALDEFITGETTRIAFTADCQTDFTSLQVTSTLFFDEGYSYSATFRKHDLERSVLFDDARPSATFDFTPESSVERIRRYVRTAALFVWQGMKHIYIGLDHILFIVALVLIAPPFWKVVKIVTAFTLAHSLTLALSAMNVVFVPNGVVEPLIALSIVYVALEDFIMKALGNKSDRLIVLFSPRRWLIAFGFGLFHGLGFAGVLRAIEIPRGMFVPSLISFNVGVEIAQITVIVLILPLLYFLQRYDWHKKFIASASVALAAVASVWFIERLL